jgi:hypothetical protein
MVLSGCGRRPPPPPGTHGSGCRRGYAVHTAVAPKRGFLGQACRRRLALLAPADAFLCLLLRWRPRGATQARDKKKRWIYRAAIIHHHITCRPSPLITFI